jgi:hypothetical protein
MASIDLDKCADAPARGHFLPGRRPEEYEQGAVRLAKSDPVHTEALEDYDDEASSDGEAGSKDEATPASSTDD